VEEVGLEPGVKERGRGVNERPCGEGWVIAPRLLFVGRSLYARIGAYPHKCAYTNTLMSVVMFTLRTDPHVSATLRTHKLNSLKSMTTFTAHTSVSTMLCSAPCERPFRLCFQRQE